MIMAGGYRNVYNDEVPALGICPPRLVGRMGFQRRAATGDKGDFRAMSH